MIMLFYFSIVAVRLLFSFTPSLQKHTVLNDLLASGWKQSFSNRGVFYKALLTDCLLNRLRTQE